ncbi:MAG: hypothetical protein KC422_25155 [Trueperaceae bacterium]|nr:hypothetical protein [Trueperaceae bacterium]
MSVYLHHIATAVPEMAYSQTFIGQIMQGQVAGNRKLERLIHHIYKNSGIAKRHSVIRDFQEGAGGLFFSPEKKFKNPGTKERNELYIEEAKNLTIEASTKALNKSTFDKEEITHVITVSCTGFFAPGADYVLVKELGLKAETERYHLGFMGCYAAFPALKMARAFCQANPQAVVLVICLELCTLHMQQTHDLDSIIASSVFADGAAAALLSAQKGRSHGALRLEHFATSLIPEGEKDMAWTLGNTGFLMRLSNYVPQMLEANMVNAVAPLLKAGGLSKTDIDGWAIHPGGRAILDKVENSLELCKSQLCASREVLCEFGNMSSATILFVLEKMIRASGQADETVYAAAFGPGLTVESALLARA